MRYFYLLIVLLIGCATYEKPPLPSHIEDMNLENLTVFELDQESEYHINLERDQVFGDSEDVFISRISDIAVDEDGRVYIADGQQLNIKVYYENGCLVSVIGRQGQGPGDFGTITDIQINDDKLYAYDISLQRSVVFDINELEYDYTINLAGNRSQYNNLQGAAMPTYYLKSDGSFFLKFSESVFPAGRNDWAHAINKGYYYLLNNEGEITSDKLFEMRSFVSVFIPVEGRPTINVPLPFLYGSSHEALSPNDDLYLNWSQDFLVKTFDQYGNYEKAFYYPYKGVPFDKESVSDAGHSNTIFFGNLDAMDLPDSWPVINDMILDDENRIWLAVITRDKKSYDWWVLEESGEFITKFSLPRSKRIKTIKNNFLYTIETEEDTEAQKVIRYQINRQM